MNVEHISQSLNKILSSVMATLPAGFMVSNLKSLLLSFVLACVGMPLLIKFFKYKQLGQLVRKNGPKRHLQKTGTPVMGGLIIILAVLLTTLIYGDLYVREIWLILFTLISFGLIGFIDDFLKISKKYQTGLGAKHKFLSQTVVSIIIIIWLYLLHPDFSQHRIYLPFAKDISFTLGIFYFLLLYIMLVGTSNAVNLTDGLDGLAIFPSILVFFGFICCTFLLAYLGLGSNSSLEFNILIQISLICAALIGAGLGFLWFNCYPATVFMGDCGSLSIGATMALVAALLQQELLLILLGGLFVLESLSVIIQVGYFKMTKRRIFKMAPLHHHFELLGWSESKVIIRFWIIAILCLVISGLALYV